MADQTSIELLRLALNVSATQQRLALENIAASNTDSLQYKSLDFSTVLMQLQNETSDIRRQISGDISNNWETIEQDMTELNFKEIKLDEEVALSLKAAGNYQKMVELMNRKMGLMKLSVSGGKR